jgi:hypothetical protein
VCSRFSRLPVEGYPSEGTQMYENDLIGRDLLASDFYPSNITTPAERNSRQNAG